MHSPYTNEPLEAYMAAQTAVAATLTAIVWWRPLRGVGTPLLLAAIWLTTLAPVEGSFLQGIGVQVAHGGERAVFVLQVATALATLGAVSSGRRSVAVVGVLGGLALYWLSGFVRDSDWELAAAHLAFFGVVVGANARDALPPAPPSSAGATRLSYPSDDAVLFTLAVTLAALVSLVVQRRLTDSADEWSYTYQAAIFARGHAYAAAPPCWSAFQNFWVFESLGHNFSQYTPGWPLFMTPFFLLHVAWLAGPFSLGLLAVGVARVARRATAGHSAGSAPRSPSYVRAGGWIAGLAVVLGATMLINGGSRFPHLFVAATYVWALEALCLGTTPGLEPKRHLGVGLLCGVSAMMTVATRPPDGALLGVGLFALAVLALARRQLPWRFVAGTMVGFAIVGGLTLVILRLQLGKWLTTGYSLNARFHPWNKFGFSMPRPNELKAALPLATGAYCWWPCSPAVGLAGMALLRGRAHRIGLALLFSVVPFVVFYEALEFGRYNDFGYGPRFELPLVVPMAIGTGVALAPLWQAARSRWHAASAFRQGGPAAVALFAALLGIVRIAPLLYPYTHQSVMAHDALHEAISAAGLQNAVVFGGPGLNNTDVRDLTENLPLDLYPDQPVIVANDLTPALRRCVMKEYPSRTFYKAVPGTPIRMQRLP